MQKRQIKMDYSIFKLNELDDQDRELIQHAIQSSDYAYNPYSKFSVGCAIRTLQGEIITACNQENIAYPSGMCAERTALFSLNTSRQQASTIAIASKDQDGKMATAFPCGACRQVMIEHEQLISKQNIRILILTTDNQVYLFESVNDLLPMTFTF